MCAAAVPSEQMVWRQTELFMSTFGNMVHAVETQLPGGTTREDVHANSLLRTGYFIRANNELARQRRSKETSSQLPDNKIKARTQVVDAVLQRDFGGVEVRDPQQPPSRKTEAEKPSTGSVSPGTDAGGGQRKPHRHDKSRQGMKQALKLARASNDLKRAKECFKKKFLASGTLLAKNAKRRKISELLSATCQKDHFPVNQEVILAISTTLDEAQLQSGDQYIHGPKLMHIEAGYDWTAPLERQLFLCKKALKRHRGPEVRAKELQVKEISEETWEEKCNDKNAYVRPAWMYAIAVAWMLRACEATELWMSDVEINFEGKKVGLLIRKSKTDQAAKGVKRTLACNGRQTCTRECPFSLAIRVLAERPNGKPGDYLFGLTVGAKRNRTHTAKCWAKVLHRDITGHSARRSGAMYYTRRGLDIQDISLLGRWRSSAVFRYMEEAMQERPMNTRAMEPTEEEAKESVVNHAQSLERWRDKLVKEDQRAPCTPGPTNLAPATPIPRTPAPGTPMPVYVPNDPEDLALWATSWTRGRKRVTHYVTKASWQVDLNEWATACGWHFAQRSVKVTLSKTPPASAHRCIKCEKVKGLRDKVPEGAMLAQLITKEIDQLLPDQAAQKGSTGSKTGSD